MDNGFKKSGIRMNQWIGQQDKWTEAELVERNNILVQRALEIWEYPSTDYKAPEKLLDMVSLEDDLSYENTRFVPQDYYDALSDTRKPELGDVLYTLVEFFPRMAL